MYRIVLLRPYRQLEWWKKGADLCQRIGDMAVHIFREHNKEADLWVDFGAKGISKEWKDESATRWTKVTGMRCVDKVCGADITISIFLQGLGWVMRCTKCRPVEGSNSLDAELGVCAMLRKVVLRSLQFKFKFNIIVVECFLCF